MKVEKKITRRKFLAAAGTTVLGTVLGYPTIAGTEDTTYAQDGTLTPMAYLPLVSRDQGGPLPGSSRVVHVHCTQATSWDFGDDYYGNFVDQNVVNEMVDQGVRQLTGVSSVEEAWQKLVPNYTPGKAIAIKVNFNNTYWCDHCMTSCEDWALAIDALIHPINALIRGLKLAYPSFDYHDVWVYDATIGGSGPGSVSNRGIPRNRFRGKCPYSGVRFFDAKGCDNYAGYESNDPTAYITWRNPSHIPTPPAMKVTDVLIDATYVINVPIMKKHGGAGVTLSFKNHFGSIADPSPLHDWISDNWGDLYDPTYNPLVDLYRNPHILGKTVLTIGDGLFGDRTSNTNKPTRWDTFGGQAPNSLFFATDPVAIDSVMCDFLHIENYEGGIYSMSDDYLKLAQAARLGVYERGEPWGDGYSRIDYRRIEMSAGLSRQMMPRGVKERRAR